MADIATAGPTSSRGGGRATRFVSRARIFGDRPPHELVAYALCLIALPFFAILATGSYFSHAGAIDPWIYTGLIHNYDDVVDRIGPTYYAARIAHIAPASLFHALLGNAWGFYAFHYVKLLIGAAALFMLGSRLQSRAVGLAAAGLWCLASWTQRAINDELYASTAATYLLLAYVFAFAPTRRPVAFHVAAGIALALATQTVQLTFGVFVTAFPSWVLVQERRSLRQLGAMVAAGAIGFVATYAASTAALQLTNPRWAEGDATIAIIKQLLAGAASTWRVTFDEILRGGYYYAYTPLLATALLLVAAFARRNKVALSRRALIGFAGLSAAPIAFYVWRQFSAHGVLNNSFTIIYLFPPFLVSIAAAFATATDKFSGALRVGAAACLCVLLYLSSAAPPLELVIAMQNHLRWTTYAAVAVAVVAIFSAAYVANRPRLGALAAGLGVIFLLMAPYQANEFRYGRIPDPGREEAWDFYGGADALMDFVGRVSPPSDGPVGFWYPNTSNKLHSIQSTYLWGYTRIAKHGAIGLPVIDSGSVEGLEHYRRYILMAETPEELQKGIDAIEAFARLQYESASVVEIGSYRKRTWGFHYAFMTRNPRPAPPIETRAQTIGWIKLASIATSPMWAPATVEPNGPAIRIVSFPGSGGFSAIVDVPDEMRRSGPGMIRVWIKVEKGAFMVWLIKRQDSSVALQQPKTAAENGGSVLIELELADLDSPASVIFANASSDGPSIATVEAIEVSQH